PQREHWWPLLRQAVAQFVLAGPTVPPIGPRQLTGRRSLSSGMDQHVVTEPGHLVVLEPALGQDLYVADGWKAVLQSHEELGIDRHLLFLRQTLAQPLGDRSGTVG